MSFQLYLWSISVPTEHLVVVHSIEHLQTSKIPNFSAFSPGVHPTSAAQTWSWSGVNEAGESLRTSLSFMTSEVLYEPLSAGGFELYYVSIGLSSRLIAVTVPISEAYDLAFRPGEQPILRQTSAIVQVRGDVWETVFCHKGWYFNKSFAGIRAFKFTVIPLKNIASCRLRKALHMFVGFEELEQITQTIEIDMDEATGRVVIWGWNSEKQETSVFVGDLV